ncbi:MAG: modified peptide precursor CbpA [Magnetococcales bacterium]|nr:modified peptide precursor CbpA [Magnetococcales bacterium]
MDQDHQQPVADAPKAPQERQPEPRPDVLAQRRRCAADGVGLSHYILMERKDP